MTSFEEARASLVRDVDTDPEHAIEVFILDLMDLDIEPDARAVAETIVDFQCSRGDYAGCSSELEMAYVEYMNWAHRALGEEI